MITTLKVETFPAVPYLAASDIIQSNPKGLVFSSEKPNVIVGPNGSGKSALMKTLSLLTMSYFGGISALDYNYIKALNNEFWRKPVSWKDNYVFLSGVDSDYDGAPALYYQPNHMFGDAMSVTHALMSGYCAEAKAYGAKTDEKSSGQKSIVLQEQFYAALDGDTTEIRFKAMNWSYGFEPEAAANKNDWHRSETAIKIEVLKERVGAVARDAKPMLLMDEPEQSLDAKAELMLWNSIASVDTSKLQVIVASHSMYPFLYPDKFHIIEAKPGYVAEIAGLLKAR